MHCLIGWLWSHMEIPAESQKKQEAYNRIKKVETATSTVLEVMHIRNSMVLGYRILKLSLN